MNVSALKAGICTFALCAPAAIIVEAQTPGINYSYIDSSANPRDDFYSFCNGTWQKNFVLPESDPRYGSFNEINEANLVKIKGILTAASKNKAAAPNTDAQRLRDFYNTAMDSMKLEEQDFKPVVEQLERIDKVTSPEDFIKLKSEFDFIGVDLLFSSSVVPDLKNSKRNIFTITQGGLGMGDRDYYILPKNNQIKELYKEHLTDLFRIVGVDRAKATEYAQIVTRIERRMSDSAFTRTQLRDIEKQYNLYTKQALAQLTPIINWEVFFRQKNMAQPDTLVVGMPGYMKNLAVMLRNPLLLESFKVYAKARLLMEAAPYLSRNFVETHFRFRGKALSGAQQIKPMWKRAQATLNATMGDIVSREFVQRYFPAESKAKVNKLIDNLVFSYRERINSRDWMSAETKKQANKKLDLMIRKIGYPAKWKSYNGLQVKTDSYWANVCRANAFLVKDNLSELKKPVDRNKWQMTAVTVNAYYDPTTNEITFPAAILQPPFFDPKADDAANYGTMGSIIGHELTHGFDDQGSQFDAQGNMKMWWTEDDFSNFKNRKQLIIEQFDNYKALDSLKVNGNMTQGENIADLGGITMAYYAYKKSLGGAKSKVIGGFTGEQRFFIAWAQGWKSKVRDAELKRLLAIDYHSPAYYRAFAPLSNLNEFYEAFGVKPGDKMYVEPSRRVEIW